MELIIFILIFGSICYFLGFNWRKLWEKYYDYQANKIKKDKKNEDHG